ncbi:hypothetical protein NDU88_001887 [Pleurodeles waltl]|uniref:Uncharacterized protein n=1 Tax=Pleurodeles waltl TaxID=8319 RepID=A0AAV7S9A6_PLEWA|nr:hypothetical protein NDU88_001887 [Pleurodeles waltl]
MQDRHRWARERTQCHRGLSSHQKHQCDAQSRFTGRSVYGLGDSFHPKPRESLCNHSHNCGRTPGGSSKREGINLEAVLVTNKPITLCTLA